MGGLVAGKAGLRIAYSNQKILFSRLVCHIASHFYYFLLFENRSGFPVSMTKTYNFKPFFLYIPTRALLNKIKNSRRTKLSLILVGQFLGIYSEHPNFKSFWYSKG
jgi:hypothetical protein